MLPAFIYANNIGRLVISLFGVEIFNPFPSFTSPSPSSGDMSNKCKDSSWSIDSSLSADSYLLSSFFSIW